METSTPPLKDLSKRNWQSLTNLGFNTFYLLGLWEHQGPIVVTQEEGINLPSPHSNEASSKGRSSSGRNEALETHLPRISSMMALTNHQIVDPRLGTQEDLTQLINHFHQLNCQVIVDFVPNHTATTHPWVTSHPEYYYQKSFPKGKDNNNLTIQPFDNFLPEFSGDVYKLNYQNPQLRQEMLRILQFISQLNIDAVRCDMAHLVPADFWSEAISIIKNQHSDFTFIAEAYPPHPFDYSVITDLIRAGFDAVYDSQLYYDLNQIILHHAPLDYLTKHISYVSSRLPQTNNYQLSTINYFCNHDDPPLNNRHNDPTIQSQIETYLESLIALTLFTPGTPFFYNGSLLGFDHRLAHHWLEKLPLQYQETENPIPDHLQQIFRLRPQITTEKFLSISVNSQLISISYSHHLITINLTPSPQPLSNFPTTQRGLVHQYTSSDQLPPGQSEIFLLP